ncbi:MAG TPA: ABC transporter substrate-binding protein [Caldilineaceae bacterium]|nr:ABC transporter substrate-binding protein [Caldilineaceae bacterium]
MKFSLRFVSLALILVLLLAACQPVQAPAGDSGPQTYVLGVAQPFTGPLGSFGTDFGKAIELAVSEMNAELSAAGSNVQFQIASADTEGTPDGAAKAVQTVVQTSGAQVVVGPLTTSEILGAKQFADDNGIVIVAPASSGVAGAIANDNIFRLMNPPDTFGGKAFLQIMAQRGYENVVILQVDDVFGNGLAGLIEEGFDGEVSIVKYAPDPADLSGEASNASAEVARLSANGPTAFFCVCFLGDAQKLLQQATVDANLGSVDWLGVENLRNEELLADASFAEFLGKVNFTSVSASSRSTPNTQPFIDAFVAMHGSEPGPFTNYAYDAANVAMLSMIAANNSGEGVKSILPYIANHYIGTQVQTFLDENGDQAIAYLAVYEVADDGSTFEEIGAYDGATDTLTMDE